MKLEGLLGFSRRGTHGADRRSSAWEFLDVDRTTREAPINVWLRAQPWLEARDTLAAFPEGGEVYPTQGPPPWGSRFSFRRMSGIKAKSSTLSRRTRSRRTGPGVPS